MNRKRIAALLSAFALILSLPLGLTAFASASETLTAQEVIAQAEGVYDSFSEHGEQDVTEWSGAVFRLGALALSKAAGREEIFEEILSSAEADNYSLNGGEETSYLEALAMSSVYAELYKETGSRAILNSIRRQLDYNCGRGFFEYTRTDRFLYTGDACILLSAEDEDQIYAQTDFVSYARERERLLDFGEGLWYRDTRYVYDGRNPRGQSFDGEKLFFARSNAMAYVSLARRLSSLKKGDAGYETYLYDFLLMSRSVKARQREDGFWNADLGESVHFRGPESTGTAGFFYGISLGISLGILDRDTYFPAAEKAYLALLSARTEEGTIGYCLPVTETDARRYAEREMREKTNEFCTGMFLLGACAFAGSI